MYHAAPQQHGGGSRGASPSGRQPGRPGDALNGTSSNAHPPSSQDCATTVNFACGAGLGYAGAPSALFVDAHLQGASPTARRALSSPGGDFMSLGRVLLSLPRRELVLSP